MRSRRHRILWLIAGVVIGIPMLLVLIGYTLPSDHVAQVEATFQTSPERVWSLVSDVTHTARWRPDVTSVEVQEPVAGRARWVENTSQGPTPFELVSQQPPREQVVRIVDEGLPFGGTWTWELVPADGGTALVMTEEGFVRNPIFRVMSRLFFKPTTTLETYLAGLSAELGESATPVILRER